MGINQKQVDSLKNTKKQEKRFKSSSRKHLNGVGAGGAQRSC